MIDASKIKFEIIPSDLPPTPEQEAMIKRMKDSEFTATIEFAPTSPLVDAYAGLATALDGIGDDHPHAEAIRSAGDVLWRAMDEAERDDARICLALLGRDTGGTDGRPDDDG